MKAGPDPVTGLTRFWLCILFLAQFALFHQYASREVAAAYPSAFDQSAYLSMVYSLFRNAQDNGFLPSFFHQLAATREAQGFMLPLQGVAFQLFFGTGRMSALLINFLYLCLAEFTVFMTARWLAKRESMGWLALGLLMLCNSVFFFAGGLFDFRIDFIAFCLYGIFICLLIRSNGFQERRWLAAAVGCALLLVSFRFITFVYLTGFFLTLLAGLLVVWRCKRGAGQEAIASTVSLKHATAAGAVWLACSLPVIFLNWKAIHDYYVVGHLTGNEKHIRAAELGIDSIGGHLTYYFKSLLRDHLGPAFVIVWLCLAAVAFVLWLASRGKKPGNNGHLAENAHLTALVAILSAIFSPWLILTANEAKSPVVASILVVPVILLIISLLARGCGTSESRPSFSSRACPLAAACSMLLGFGNWMNQLSRAGLVTLNRDSVEQIDDFYGYLMNEARENGIKSPVISSDDIKDWLASETINDRLYETHGSWLGARGGLGYGIKSINHDEVFKLLGQSDFVLLTDFPKQGVYPFFASMDAMEPEMRAWCESHLMRGREFQIYGGTVTVYELPAVKLEGGSSGWVTPEGVRFRLTEAVLSWLQRTSKTRLVLEGDYNAEWLDKTPVATLQLLDASGALTAPDTAPVLFTSLNSRHYRLMIDINKLAGQSLKDNPYIVLRFGNSYFIPKELGINADLRKLVIRPPTTIRFE